MGEQQPAARTLSILDADAVKVAGGALDWIPVRRRLGITAFGTNAYRAAKAGDLVIEEHVESPGQEEIYVVVTGCARIVVDGEEFDCPAGTVLFVDRPEAMRSATALEDGTAVLAVGGWPDQAYHVLPWEPIYLAQEAMRSGDWALAAQTLEREAGEHRQTAAVQYRLACCYARAGDGERALAELRGAIAVNPALKQRATTEEHLASLRGGAGWSELIE
jgi:hypothetical protein